MYAFSTYGVDGVDHALQILQVSFAELRSPTPDSNYVVSQDELEMNLRLLGAQTIKDLVPDMVDASNVHSHLVTVPRDQLYDTNCTPLCLPARARI